MDLYTDFTFSFLLQFYDGENEQIDEEENKITNFLNHLKGIEIEFSDIGTESFLSITPDYKISLSYRHIDGYFIYLKSRTVLVRENQYAVQVKKKEDFF